MKQPDPSPHLACTLPDPATTAHHLSAIITLVQTARAALRDDEPENATRAEAALGAVLGSLSTMYRQFDKAAQWQASSVWTDAGRHLM